MSDAQEPMYVRYRGRIAGPYTLEQVIRMVSRGQISRLHELSLDRQQWRPAAEYEQLFAARHKHAPNDELQGSSSASSGQIELGDTPPGTLASSVLSPSPLGTPAGDNAAGNSRNRSPVLAMVLGALFLGAIILYVTRPVSQQPTVTNTAVKEGQANPAASSGQPVAASLQGSRVTSIRDDKVLGSAVGFVVAGWSMVGPEGKEIEVPIFTGTCFFVSPNGDALTNAHVVQQTVDWMRAQALKDKIRRDYLVEWTPQIWVFVNGVKCRADPVHVSSTEDLALIRVSCNSNSFFTLSASSTRVARGQNVFAMGFPGIASTPVSTEEGVLEVIKSKVPQRDVKDVFKDRDFTYSLTTGIVSRSFAEAGGRVWIQHEATVSRGNSGGPLVDESGVVVGINTLKQSDESGAATNLALEIAKLRSEIAQHYASVEWK